MAKSPVKVVLDSNVFVSALVFGGKPENIVRGGIDQNFQGVISPPLLVELLEVLAKKFNFSSDRLQVIEEDIKDSFEIVYPKFNLSILKDEDDNRVLEAASEGGCSFIVTGDKELLKLSEFRGIKVLTPDEFLKRLAFGC